MLRKARTVLSTDRLKIAPRLDLRAAARAASACHLIVYWKFAISDPA